MLSFSPCIDDDDDEYVLHNDKCKADFLEDWLIILHFKNTTMNRHNIC